MSSSTNPRGISWASYVAQSAEAEQAPAPADVPDNRRAARNVLLATLLAAALVFLTIALPRVLGVDAWRFALDLVGAVALFLWLLLVFPQSVAHRRARRWRREFLRLCADPQRADGRLRGLQLRRQGESVTVVGGSVEFADANGTPVEVPLVSGLGKIQGSFQAQLPSALAPSDASRAVVWFTPDLTVIHTRVHADGSGTA